MKSIVFFAFENRLLNLGRHFDDTIAIESEKRYEWNANFI